MKDADMNERCYENIHNNIHNKPLVPFVRERKLSILLLILSEDDDHDGLPFGACIPRSVEWKEDNSELGPEGRLRNWPY